MLILRAIRSGAISVLCLRGIRHCPHLQMLRGGGGWGWLLCVARILLKRGKVIRRMGARWVEWRMGLFFHCPRQGGGERRVLVGTMSLVGSCGRDVDKGP